MLSENGRETAEFLLQAFRGKQIEGNFSFLVISERGKPDHIKPLEGIKDPAFRIPLHLLSNLFELMENKLIEVYTERTENINKRWDIKLKNELRRYILDEQIVNEQTRIFISYSSQDQRIKSQLENELLKNYPNIWSDKSIQGGEKFWHEIFDKIAECSIFIYLLSPDSITSFACRVELAEALRNNKPIIPVKVRPTTSPPYIQTTYHTIDATIVEPNQISNEISAAIKKIETSQTPKAFAPPNWKKSEKLSVEKSRLEVTVLVPANIEPTITQKEQLNTGVLLLPNDILSISATGKITNDILDGQPRTWISADGIDQKNRCSIENHAYWNDRCVGMLIGWVGLIDEYKLSAAFPVGKSYKKSLRQEDDSGFLYLAINDNINQYGDNGGEFVVTITVR